MVRHSRTDGRLKFTTRLEDGIADADCAFICVGTPPQPDGSCDLSYVRQVAGEIGRHMQRQNSQGFDPLTGEVFDAPRPSPLELLRNGLDVLCAGRITLYAPRGQYQLAVELVQPAGEGLLAQAFEASKRKLAALGYFSQERKRPLPYDPQRVALITSPTGAAIHALSPRFP